MNEAIKTYAMNEVLEIFENVIEMKTLLFIV